MMMKRHGILDVDSSQDGLALRQDLHWRADVPSPLAYHCSNTTPRAGANQRYWGNSS